VKQSGTYCVMSCQSWNSPLFCDKDHPQDVFSDNDGRSTWNHLVNAVLADGGARTQYLAQVRAVQVDSNKLELKAPGIKRLKL